MFEAIHTTTAKINDETIAGTNMPVKSASASQAPKKEDQPKKTEEAEKRQEVEKRQEAEVSQDFLDALEQDIEMIHNVGLHFSVHESTGRTMVRVVNKDNGNLIREIPPKEILDLAAKLDEMIGTLFDKKV